MLEDIVRAKAEEKAKEIQQKISDSITNNFSIVLSITPVVINTENQ